MIHSKLRLFALAVVASLAVTGAQAATVSASAGDLLLGFRALGGTGQGTPYVVNLGDASVFRDLANNTTLTLTNASASVGIGNIGADLSSIFGASWSTRTDLYWGIVGFAGAESSDPAFTLYAGRARTNSANQVAGYSNTFSSNQSSVASSIQNAYTGYVSPNNGVTTRESTGNSDVAVLQNETNDSNDWKTTGLAGNTASATAFGYFSNGTPRFDGRMSVASNRYLDLFRIPSIESGESVAAEGVFNLGADGTLTFTSVPEPSTYALIAIAASMLFIFRRRAIKA